MDEVVEVTIVGKDEEATWGRPARQRELWFTRETACCPAHGGPTWEQAVEEMVASALDSRS